MAKRTVTTETYPRGQRSAAGASVPGLSIPDHDHIEMTYSGGNLTGVQYFSTATGTGEQILRAQLELKYDGGNNLVSVSRVD